MSPCAGRSICSAACASASTELMLFGATRLICQRIRYGGSRKSSQALPCLPMPSGAARRKAYTLDTAARARGISRRMVAYYEQGARPIPRVVALATARLNHAGKEDLPFRHSQLYDELGVL